MGMPRRIYSYPAHMGWDIPNMIVSIGSFLFAAGVLLLLINILVSLRRGRLAGPNPWDAPTLEWSVSSPPPPYNFAVIPNVESRHPLWEDALNETPARSRLDQGLLLDHGRETVATTPLDAEPDLILQMPGDTLAPFALAVGLTVVFVGGLLQSWGLGALGVAVSCVALAAWFWPRRAHLGDQGEEPADG
jgi:cytochrome c oxidase subunit 1/cytochrome c oxidase subunit I+III